MTSVTYKRPGWFTKHVLNPAVALASLPGSAWRARGG